MLEATKKALNFLLEKRFKWKRGATSFFYGFFFDTTQCKQHFLCNFHFFVVKVSYMNNNKQQTIIVLYLCGGLPSFCCCCCKMWCKVQEGFGHEKRINATVQNGVRFENNFPGVKLQWWQNRLRYFLNQF